MKEKFLSRYGYYPYCNPIIVFCMLVFTGLFASCDKDRATSDANVEDSEVSGLTEFSATTSTDSVTRTAGSYSGSGVDFYWTAGDNIWINTAAPAAPPVLVQSVNSNINAKLAASGKTKTGTAKFYFPGTYTASTYPIRYTGNNSTSGDKVTIAATQQQQTPNDASHLGNSGDCGTAVATKKDNDYTFTIDHKASYLTFLPFSTQTSVNKAKISQIKVTANKAIAGTYNFNDAGIDTNSPTATSTDITLKCGSAGFEIPTVATPETNACTMVLAPGTYSTLTVEYSIMAYPNSDPGTISKTYYNITLSPGKNKRVSQNLQVPIYPADSWYQWDAIKHYWFGFENKQPQIPGPAYAPRLIPNHSQAQANSTINFPAQASGTCASCPNVNEMFWYVERGAPYYDRNALWEMHGYLRRGGLWLKKKNNIPGFTAANAPNGQNYVNISSSNYANLTNVRPPNGRPVNMDDYFCLPLLGNFSESTISTYLGEWQFSGTHLVWFSRSSSRGTEGAYALYFLELNGVLVRALPRYTQGIIWPAQ